MSWLLLQLLWFGLAAAVMLIDARMVRAQEDPSAPDLKDRSIGPFLALGVIFGGLVIPFYLWYSRGTAGAVAAGVGIMLALGIVLGLVRAAAGG